MFAKNTAGQFFYFQGVDATTGGIKSGVSWTIRRCIDGTFAAATGTVTEDGSTGWYKFAMSQADTNGNNIGFNFTGTGAVPQTVSILTDGSSTAQHVIVDSGTVTTLTNLPAITANWLTAAGINASALNGKGDWNIGKTAYSLSSTGLDSVTYNSTGAQALAKATWVDAVAGDFTVAGSIGKSVMNGVALGTGLTVNDLTTKTGYALAANQHVIVDSGTVTTLTNLPAAAALEATAQSILTDTAEIGVAGAGLTAVATAAIVEGTITLAESVRLLTAVLAGKISGAGTGTEVFRGVLDNKDRVIATVDSSGNRTAIVLDDT